MLGRVEKESFSGHPSSFPVKVKIAVTSLSPLLKLASVKELLSKK
jgi:hypothetical protein